MGTVIEQVDVDPALLDGVLTPTENNTQSLLNLCTEGKIKEEELLSLQGDDLNALVEHATGLANSDRELLTKSGGMLAAQKSAIKNHLASLIIIIKGLHKQLIKEPSTNEAIKEKNKLILSLTKENNTLNNFRCSTNEIIKISKSSSTRYGVRRHLYYQASAKKCCSAYINSRNLVDEACDEIVEFINNSGKAYASPRPTGIVIQTSCYCGKHDDNCEASKLIKDIRGKYSALNEDSAKVNKLFNPRLQVSTSKIDADFSQVEKVIKKNFPDHADNLKFVRIVTSRVNRKGNAKIFIVEVDTSTRSVIAGHNASDPSMRVHIRDSIFVRFCVKCLRYGHSQNRCHASRENQADSLSEGEMPHSHGGNQPNPSNVHEHSNPNLIQIPANPSGFTFPFIQYPNPNLVHPSIYPQADHNYYHHDYNHHQSSAVTNRILCQKCSSVKPHHPLSLKCYQRYKFASGRVALIDYGTKDDNKVILWEL